MNSTTVLKPKVSRNHSSSLLSVLTIVAVVSVTVLGPMAKSAPAADATLDPDTHAFAAIARTADTGIVDVTDASDVRPESPRWSSDADERPREIYSRLISSPSVRTTVRTGAPQALDIDVEARPLGFSITAEAVGTPQLAIESADEELQKVFVGELSHDAPFVLVVNKRADGTQNIVVAVRGQQAWETRLVARAGPDDVVRISGSYVVVAEHAEPEGERDYLYSLISPENEPAMIWVPRRTLSVAPMATDAGIRSPEDAALHVTAFNEGTLTPWDCPNQPYDGTAGFLYGRTSANGDGALLSFGIFQWNFWSGTLPPMLRRFEQIDSNAFWSAFNGLDVTAFRSEVMSSTTTVARSYEWARQRVPGGTWLTSKGVACSGYGSDCRWTGGSMLTTWRDAFSKLGSVPAFQAEQRKTAIDNYITPVKNGRYQTLNTETGRTWSLRSLLVLIDFANQYGPAYGNNTACSLSAWIANSTGCSRNTTGAIGYSATLSDQANTKRLPAFLEPSTYRYRRDSIATGDGTVKVNGAYPAWDSYFARYNVSLNAPPGSSSSGGPPAAPSGLAASALSSSSIKFTWADNSNNEASFVVARWNGSAWSTIGSVGSNVTSYTDSGLQASTTYYYSVCARNSAGTNCASNYAYATTQGSNTMTIPAAPTGLRAMATSSSSIRFTWADNSNNEASFVVARWNGSAWSTIGSVGSNVTSYTDSGLRRSTTYYYTVCARNSAGTNCASTYAYATTP